jgi:hypothetical protein
MAVSDRAAAVGGYAQQLLDNQDVQATARQAADATKAAYQRARGQDPRDAVQDRKLRRRVATAVAAAGEFLGAVSKTEPKPKSPWPRRIAVVTIIAAAAALLFSSEGVRARIRGLLGQTGSDNQTDPSTVDATYVPPIVEEPNSSSIVDPPNAA